MRILRQAIIVVALSTAALLLSRSIVSSSGSVTIGTLVRIGASAALPLFVVLVLASLPLSDLGSSTRWLVPEIRIEGIILVGALGSGIAWLLSLVGSQVSLMHYLVLLCVLAGIVTSFYWLLARRFAQAMATLLVVLPFIGWLEWEWRATGWTTMFLGPFALSPSIVYLWLFFLALLSQRLLTKQGLVGTRLDKWVAAWVLLLFISSLASPDPFASLRRFFVEVLTVTLCYYLITNSVHSRRGGLLIIGALAVYSLLTVSLAFYFYTRTGGGFSLQQPTLYGWEQGRSYYDVGILARMAAVGVTLFIGLVYEFKSGLARVGFLSVAGALGTFVLMTETRAVLVALATLLAALLLTGRARSKLVWIAAVTIVVSVVVLGGGQPGVVARFSVWDSLDSILIDQEARLDAWQAAFRMMLDRPLAGIGLGQWMRVYPQYALHADWSFASRISSAHSFYLHYGSAGGVGVLLIQLIMMGLAGWQAVTLWRKTRQSSIQALADAVIWTFALICVLTAIGSMTGLADVLERNLTVGTFIPFDGIFLGTGVLFWSVISMLFALDKLLERSDTMDATS